jgi:hypothetical protein
MSDKFSDFASDHCISKPVDADDIPMPPYPVLEEAIADAITSKPETDDSREAVVTLEEIVTVTHGGRRTRYSLFVNLANRNWDGTRRDTPSGCCRPTFMRKACDCCVRTLATSMAILYYSRAQQGFQAMSPGSQFLQVLPAAVGGYLCAKIVAPVGLMIYVYSKVCS